LAGDKAVTAIAKTNSNGVTRSLVGHSLDVAHAAHKILTTGVTRARLSILGGFPLTDVHVDRLSVLVGLHDFGKATRGFQVRIGVLAGADGGHLAEAHAGLRHPKIGAALAQAMRGPIITRWCDNPVSTFDALIGHHGQPVSEPDILRCAATASVTWANAPSGYDPIAEVQVLVDALFAAFPKCMGMAASFPDDTRFEHAVAGLTMGADWLGSSLALVGPDNRAADVASTLATLPWAGWHSGAPHEAMLGSHTARAAQVAALTLPLEQMAIIEAPTGSGKTEASLIWASRLVEAGLVDGLYFGVPTRSAATELHARISALMTAAHPYLRGKIIRAVPGAIETDDGMLTTWAVGSSRKTQSAPVAVGSIDQALLSQVRNRHAWMRSLWLARHLLIIDEVHASDTYTGELVLRLVQEHMRAGGYVLAMSATLGEAFRSTLESRGLMPLAQAVAREYPIVTSGRNRMPVAAPGRSVRVNTDGYRTAMAHAIHAVQNGKAVLWIRSTVANAIDDWEQLRQQGVPVILHHSRYADEDRAWLDAQVLGVIGLGGRRRGVVIVGTQTLEQSLDIDADLLVTDACPADVLLQRLGRLYRHRTGAPLAVLIHPEPWETYVGATRFQALQRWHFVYSPLMVRATLEWVTTHGLIRVPEDVRELVETATHPAHLAARAQHFGPQWTAIEASMGAAAMQARQEALAGLIDRGAHYRNNLVDGRVPTRLGDGTVEVPVQRLVSPFTGRQLASVPIRAKWISGIPQGTVGVVGQPGVIDVGGLQFFYDERGLRR
jgi:CRISPR-associated endonuclease/helicase Cas3